MTKYERLMSLAKIMHDKALSNDCVDMKIFFLNASKGYEEKARKLTIQEAMELV